MKHDDGIQVSGDGIDTRPIAATLNPMCAQIALTLLRMRIAMFEEGIWIKGDEHDQVITWAYLVAGNELTDWERAEYFPELEARCSLT